MKVSAFGLLLALVILAPGVHATATTDLVMPSDAKHLKLGLWETIRQSESAAPPVALGEAELKSLDPAARARVEAVLKRQAAERAARGGAPRMTTHSKRECLTQAVLDKRTMSFDEGGNSRRRVDCPPVVKSRSPSRAEVTGTCNVDGHTFTVDMIFEVKSSEETVAQVVTSGEADGAPGSTKVIATSHWLGAACGDAPLAH